MDSFTCGICRKSGHKTRDCPNASDGNSRDRSSSSSRGDATASSTGRRSGKYFRINGKRSRDSSHVNMVLRESSDDEDISSHDRTVNAIFAPNVVLSALPVPSPSGFITWALDSACTEHIVSQDVPFSTKRDFGQREHGIYVADERMIYAKSVGDIAPFRKVYYYPEVMRNLLSEGALWDSGWTIQYTTDGTGDKYLISPDAAQPPLRAHRHHRLWIVHTPMYVQQPMPAVDEVMPSTNVTVYPTVTDIIANTVGTTSCDVSLAEVLSMTISGGAFNKSWCCLAATSTVGCKDFTEHVHSPAVTDFLRLHILLSHVSYRTLYEAI